MAAYYNEIEPYAAQWLRNLIAAGHIAEGDVDERSIVEIEATDLKNYEQCHFFAGIGVWSYALRRAGWADGRKVWTGSCPCQPFSAAGLKKGVDDQRHLWPAWAKLIAQCRPDVIFGEQVASRDALSWLDTVYADLEAEDYAVGAIDFCAAGVGAPHLRQRLWWVAESDRQRRAGKRVRIQPGRPFETLPQAAWRGAPGALALAASRGRREERPIASRDAEGNRPQGLRTRSMPGSNAGKLGRPNSTGSQIRSRKTVGRRAVRIEGQAAAKTGAVGGYWQTADLIWRQDGKYRPVEPGTFPLAHGIANRVGRLRATGNALVAPVAEAFVKAYLSSTKGQ